MSKPFFQGFALRPIFLALCLAAASPWAVAAPLQVTVTIGQIGDVAKAVGGEQVQVTALMGPGVDPHLYKATQGDLKKLSEAGIVLYNGLHLEGRMADVLVKFARQVPTVQVTESIPQDLLREPPEFNGNYDPHVWFDVSLWAYTADRVRDALTELRPEQGAYFADRAKAYRAELATLETYVKQRATELPESARVLVTAHDAFGYFGRAYGFEVLGLQGISTASEYGLQDVSKLVDVLVARKIKAVFVESSVSPRSIEALLEGARAKGHDVKIGGQLFSDAMGEPGTPEGTYIGMVRHNIDTIVEALKP
ncbi:MAG: zinc ABC transporter substrate-binding protein [Candidatus Hydrogenedentes bacterium]|nr:zinc ABC transporter substrate-binding protein [Candidatus Hydrogenedentota bacterium]